MCGIGCKYEYFNPLTGVDICRLPRGECCSMDEPDNDIKNDGDYPAESQKSDFFGDE